MSIYDDIKQSKISVFKVNDQQIKASFEFQQDLDIFIGHFPGDPMLPGVFQIEMVKYVLEELYGTALNISSIKKTKFSSLIRPDIAICLDITINKQQGGQLDVKAILRAGDKIAGKTNLILIKKDVSQ
jgi:3-hydroxyacyl-[acyl-carrier-protein] dehydratase